MTLLEKSKKLYDLREKIHNLEDAYKQAVAPFEVQRAELQDAILKELQETGQYSARFDFATISRAVRKTLQVIDETKVVAYLKKKKLAKEYVSERLNNLFHSSLAKEIVKSGTKIPGTEVNEKEYISIYQPSAKEDKRKQNVE